MNVAVTGASGYVGGILCRALDAKGHHVLAWSRRPCPGDWAAYDLKDDPAGLPWSGVDALVHAAYDFGPRSWQEILAGNVEPAIQLLRAACDHGVKRLVFISSISSFDGTKSNYGKAKRMIEKAALELGVVIIRPGLVWGESSGGVMGALENLVMRLPVVPYLSGRGGLAQFLVHEQDLTTAVVQAVESPTAEAAAILEVANPDPVPLRRILITIAKRRDLRRFFIPLPWQLAMAALRSAEFLGVDLSFRSDSLTGLVRRTPALGSNDLENLRLRCRSFI
jgi:nucleoside-diphosphate-sugar epimerase